MDSKIICNTVYATVAILVIGEMFGGVISRPIAAARGASSNKRLTSIEIDIYELKSRVCKLEKGKEA